MQIGSRAVGRLVCSLLTGYTAYWVRGLLDTATGCRLKAEGWRVKSGVATVTTHYYCRSLTDITRHQLLLTDITALEVL